MKKNPNRVLNLFRRMTPKHAAVIGASIPLIFGAVNSARVYVASEKDIASIKARTEQAQGHLNRLQKYALIKKPVLTKEQKIFLEIRDLMYDAGFMPRIQYRTHEDYLLQKNPVLDWVPIPSSKGIPEFNPVPKGKTSAPLIDSLASPLAISKNSPSKQKTLARKQTGSRRRA